MSLSESPEFAQAVADAVESVKPQDGDIVEFFVQGHGERLGIVNNIAPRRVVARINHARTDGTVVGYDVDGFRVIVPSDAVVLVPADRVQAGWASL